MAATDERARHELYLAFEDLIGAEKPDTLMAALLTSDRSELATKADIEFAINGLRTEFHEHRAETRQLLAEQRAEMHDQFRQQFRSIVVTVIVAVGAMNSATVAAVAALTG